MNVTKFPTFTSSYRKLEQLCKNKVLKIYIQLYHHDEQSEPCLSIEGDVQNIMLEEVEGHGKVISIMTAETMVTFTEDNYFTNISNDAVVFSSKKDDETYYIIEFI